MWSRPTARAPVPSWGKLAVGSRRRNSNTNEAWDMVTSSSTPRPPRMMPASSSPRNDRPPARKLALRASSLARPVREVAATKPAVSAPVRTRARPVPTTAAGMNTAARTSIGRVPGPLEVADVVERRLAFPLLHGQGDLLAGPKGGAGQVGGVETDLLAVGQPRLDPDADGVRNSRVGLLALQRLDTN